MGLYNILLHQMLYSLPLLVIGFVAAPIVSNATVANGESHFCCNLGYAGVVEDGLSSFGNQAAVDKTAADGNSKVI